MVQISTTPFGARPLTAGDLARARAHAAAAARHASAPAAGAVADKWALLRELAAARAAFGVSDRDLAVLGALLGFHPARGLDPAAAEGLVVFPSNAALSERAHGMAESTLRRHLSALAAAGLIRRQDSPNGKRYAARDASGALARAFGLDLAPLAWRASEIAAAARAAREAELRLKRLRETAMLRLRDAEKLVAYGAEAAPAAADWPGFAARAAAARRDLRRRLAAAEVAAATADLGDLLAAIGAALAVETPTESEKMDGSAAGSERRHQNSNPEDSESESRLEPAVKRPEARPEARRRASGTSDPGPGPSQGPGGWTAPFDYVRRACPEIALYARDGLNSWSDLVVAAEFVRPMLGVSAEVWAEARAAMGERAAATTLACILESADRIARPGGYLRTLAARARGPGFSPTPMVAALANRRAAS